MERCITEIENLVMEEETRQTLPEITRFAKLLEKAAHIEKRVKVDALRRLLNYKAKWSLKEIDGLQLKIQEMIEEESTEEFISNEKKIDHQYRTIMRLEPPNVDSVQNREESFGTFELKDFAEKRNSSIREVSNPIAIDGQIWSLEIDLNNLVKNYISLLLVSTNCAALKLDPTPLCQIKLMLVHPKESHASIKKTL